MQIINCTIGECIDRVKNKRIFVFGAGTNIRFYESSDMKVLKENVCGILDNGNLKEYTLFGKTFFVSKPDILKNESECAVIITTSVFMVEMCEQLKSLNLSEDIEVYIHPLMTIQEDHRLTEKERQILFNGKLPKIPKVIHSFWFSKTKKPYDYQKCVDSWKKFCPDYEIREYNADNYDISKHPFLKKAVEVGAWAAATDFSRLEVTSREGGIYLDMDVELLKPLDSVLGHESIFSFFSDGAIDLAAFAVSEHNPLPELLLKCFDRMPIYKDKEAFSKIYYKDFYAPEVVMHDFERYGVKMNGKFQEINDNLFLPRYLMMPLDCAIYEMNDDNDTFAVHRANAGWKEDSYAAKKAEKNKAFYREVFGG